MTPKVEAAIARLETFAYERSLAGHDIDEIAPEIRTLISAYREAERDAARYRWLRDLSHWTWTRPPMRAITVYWKNDAATPAELSKAIDAAIAKGGSHAG